MRSPKQVKVIVSQLDFLEELKQQLENILENINMLMKKGNSWLEETDNMTYIDIYQYLTNETAECMKQCEDIAGGQCIENLTDESSLRRNVIPALPLLKTPIKPHCGDLLKHLEQFDQSNSTQAKVIKKLKRKQKDQEKRIETLAQQKEEAVSEYDAKYEQIMEEFQAASSFMASLKTQLEKLTIEVTENKQLLSQISDGRGNLVNVQMKEIEQEKKFNKILTTQDYREKEISSQHEEYVQRVDKLYSEQEIVFAKLAENEKTIANVLISLETVVNTDVNLKDQEKAIKVMNSKLTKQEVGNIEKFDKIENRVQTVSGLAISLQNTLKTLTSEIHEKNKIFEKTSLDVLEQKKNISDSCKDVSSVKASYIQCQLLEDMMKREETLNSQISNLTRKIDELSTSVADISKKDVTIAFCAQKPRKVTLKNLKKDQILTCFNHLINLPTAMSTGYNPDTGIFTVPCDGIYLVGLMVENAGDTKFGLHICYKDKNGSEYLRSPLKVSVKDSVGCVVSPLYLNKNGQLYIKPECDVLSDDIQLGNSSFYMCMLIKTL